MQAGWKIESGVHLTVEQLKHPPCIWSTFKILKELFSAEAPYMQESVAQLHTEEPPDAPSMHAKDLRASVVPFSAMKDPKVPRRTSGYPKDLNDLYFLECNRHCVHQGQQWNYSDGWRRDQCKIERILWGPTECRKWKGRAWAYIPSDRADTISKWHRDRETTLSKTGRTKVCGPDNLPIEEIMVVAEMKPELLTYIRQQIMANGIPDSWMKSKRIPRFKKQRWHHRMQQVQGNQVDESLHETMGTNYWSWTEINGKYKR